MERPTAEALRGLYIDERMTTRQIAAIYAVDKFSVCRWLAKHDIPKRHAGRGLANRGLEAPGAAELHRLLNVEHLGYRGVAERYGVDFTAVPHWCRKLGVRAPTVWETRYGGQPPVLPDASTLAGLYADGESLVEIGARFGVSRLPIRDRLKAAGITLRRDGWDGGKRFTCADGHRVRSTYEQRVCEWLTERGIEHAYEPRLPWDLRSRADFLANGWYVEVWGVIGLPVYAARQARKIAAYRAHGAALVQINHWDFSTQKRRRWQRLLAITSSPARCF